MDVDMKVLLSQETYLENGQMLYASRIFPLKYPYADIINFEVKEDILLKAGDIIKIALENDL